MLNCQRYNNYSRIFILLNRHWRISSMATMSSSSSASAFVTAKNQHFSLSHTNLYNNSKGLFYIQSSSLNPNPNPSQTSISAFPLSQRSMSMTSYDSIIATNTINSSRPMNWRDIKSCRCSNNRDNVNISSSKNVNFININDNNNDVIISKARAFAPSLCRHSEKAGLQEKEGEEEDNQELKLVNNVTHNGANHRGSTSNVGSLNQPEKIVVAVDVDEVLGSFLSALNRFIADRYSSSHSISEYHVYEFFKIWNCSRGEADIRVHEFFKTCYFKKGIHPIPGARQTLEKLSRFCSLSVVTSRQNAIKDHTIEWIEKHYPGLFEEIHFGNHFALDGQSRPKSDICRSLGANVLIDDNPRYAIECAEVGIRVLLFDYENSYPWSKSESVTKHPLVTRVHNWGEVEHRLASRTFS